MRNLGASLCVVVIGILIGARQQTSAQEPSDTKEYFRLLTAETLGDARDRLASHKFKDDELFEIIVDGRKRYNAVLFRVKKKADEVIAVDIYVARPRETGVQFMKTLSRPSSDLATLVQKLKL